MSEKLIRAGRALCRALDGLAFSEEVACVYNPLIYARVPHELFLKKYGAGTKKVLFLGMNPGPYGMAQTGVPFGEIPAVRDWMGISAPVKKPTHEHPKRPVTGFDCERSEVSGRRLWGLFAEEFPSAEEFFSDHFVVNFCPLVWMKESGANITPDKLSKESMAPVDAACLAHLVKMIRIFQPKKLIGVGAYAEKKLQEAAQMAGVTESVVIGKILHPSPASPAANRDFAGTAKRQLQELGII